MNGRDTHIVDGSGQLTIVDDDVHNAGVDPSKVRPVGQLSLRDPSTNAPLDSAQDRFDFGAPSDER